MSIRGSCRRQRRRVCSGQQLVREREQRSRSGAPSRRHRLHRRLAEAPARDDHHHRVSGLVLARAHVVNARAPRTAGGSPPRPPRASSGSSCSSEWPSRCSSSLKKTPGSCAAVQERHGVRRLPRSRAAARRQPVAPPWPRILGRVEGRCTPASGRPARSRLAASERRHGCLAVLAAAHCLCGPLLLPAADLVLLLGPLLAASCVPRRLSRLGVVGGATRPASRAPGTPGARTASPGCRAACRSPRRGRPRSPARRASPLGLLGPARKRAASAPGGRSGRLAALAEELSHGGGYLRRTSCCGLRKRDYGRCPCSGRTSNASSRCA